MNCLKIYLLGKKDNFFNSQAVHTDSHLGTNTEVVNQLISSILKGKYTKENCKKLLHQKFLICNLKVKQDIISLPEASI